MHFSIVTLFPEMFQAVSQYGITSRAVEKGLIKLSCFNPRDYAEDRHKTVDDRPYGGGPGMVMSVYPLRTAIQAAKKQINQIKPCKTIFLSPQGKKIDQKAIQNLAKENALILVAGRYEGIDERLIQLECDEEWSLGDYVLSGGELAAMVIIDAVTRLLPGALGHEDSAQEDSFSEGLLDCPHYTRPPEIEGLTVPEVLLSGDHAAIARWRLKQRLGRTYLRRPDLLESLNLDKNQKELLQEFLAESIM